MNTIRNATPNQRLWFINLLTSQFSYHNGNQRLVPTGICIPDHDIDAEGGKSDYHYTFANGDCIPCLDCIPEVIVNQWGDEFTKALVTDKFTYYCNFEESDENGAYIMFRGKVTDYDLASDNYLAANAFIYSLAKEKNPIHSPNRNRSPQR